MDKNIRSMLVELKPDEYEKIWQSIGKLGSPVSLRKVARTLLILWADGEIELTREEVLAICPDGRVKDV